MISVSNEWVAAHKETLLPEMFVEISGVVTEPGLQEDATVSSDNEASFANTDDILNPTNTDKTYATLEHGLWGLDGSLLYLDSESSDTSYVSDDLSESDGSFATYPTITFEFSGLHVELIPGITIVWSDAYNEWASEFIIEAYNSSGVVAQKTVTGNTSPKCVVWLDLVGYKKIVIKVVRWSAPYHRARCSNVVFGITKVYTKDDLVGFEHVQSADLLSAKLPQSNITFRLRNDNNTWNPDSPSNFEKYLLEEQRVDVRYGMDVNGDIEWIKGGSFWLSEWETPSNGMEAVFKARDSIAFMLDKYTGPRNGTAYDIAEAALIQEGLSDNRYVLDESLRDILIDFSKIDDIYRTSDVLQRIAHAGRCVFHQDRDGVVRIEPWKREYSGYMIEPDISYSHPEYTIGKLPKAISVTYGDSQETQIDVSLKGEIQTINNSFISSEEDAIAVAEVAREILLNRKVISGEYRADVRLDVLDNIIVTSKYSSNIIGVTDIRYSTTGGAFRGTYTGRVVSFELKQDSARSGEFYVGENELWF